MRSRAVWLGVLLAGVAIGAATACRFAPPQASVAAGKGPAGPRSVSRNVEASDYAGSKACAACHAEIARTFASSPMHRMTRMIADTDVAAPFQGESLTLADDRTSLETHGGARFVRVTRGGSGESLLYRVTRVIGGRHREDFVGVRVAGYEDAPKVGEGDELVLPVSYLIKKKRLRYKGYSVMVRERDRLEAGPVWDRTCTFCHNTVPLLTTMLGALAGPKAPHFQGEVVDSLLPDDRALRYSARDEGGLAAAVSREMRRIGGKAPSGELPSVLSHAIDTTRQRFTGGKLLEVGIGCESCHGGSREHVVDPSVRPSLLPRAPYLDVRGAGGAPITTADAENHACARCHQVLFSRYPWTWEGGRRQASPGGSHINSGEARDLLLGGCKGALACTMCHDPHAADESAHLAALETPRGNEVCLSCHAALRSKDSLRAHAHHDPEGAGGACLACHMPKKNMSLEGELTRYHRIGSPTEPSRVLLDRPLECAVCHADRSVEALVSTMETWWGHRYDRDVLRASYGDLGANALRATLARGKPHEKAVALAVLGANHDRQAASLFAAELGDEYPLLRDFAASALLETFGSACDLHLGGDLETRSRETKRCEAAAHVRLEAPRTDPSRPPAGTDEPVSD